MAQATPEVERRFLSTAQAAQMLSVGVTTVKRWVEEGRVPAQKTIGGHRKILVGELIRFARSNNLPVPQFVEKPPLASDTPELLEHLIGALRQFDPDGLRRVIHGAFSCGRSFAAIADELIAPAMVAIGHQWESGKIDVMHEHRSTQALVGVLYEMKAFLRGQIERDGPIALGGAPEHDPYLIATLLAKLTLLDEGWNAINLGPQTPLSAMRTAIIEYRPKLVWLSVSHVQYADDLVRECEGLLRQTDQYGARLVIGGSGVTADLLDCLPSALPGKSMADLVTTARQIYFPSQMPKRGRPPKDAY